MVEINPLVVTKDGKVLALDAKMSFDDNAMFRRRKIADMRDQSQEDPREAQAAEHGLSYVGLDGDIGCIVNGAGLAMATMDMIKLRGRRAGELPRCRRRRLAGARRQAFRLVLSDRNVKAILVNIFAGINRCDWVAQGVVQAAEEIADRCAADRAPRRHQCRGGHEDPRRERPPIITADTLADAARQGRRRRDARPRRA